MQKNFEEYPKYLFHEGTNIEADKLFCPKKAVIDGKKGWIFRVWAPNARDVSLVGDFNGWEVGATPMKKDDGGIWEVFVEGLKVYDAYKYAVTSKKGKTVLKADPYGLHFETTPQTASKLYDLSGYKWKDAAWLKSREEKNIYESPMNIYEVHLGSWKRHDDGNVYSYVDLADELVEYVKKNELYPRRIHARDGISFRRQLGISGNGAFRADVKVRHAARLYVSCGQIP